MKFVKKGSFMKTSHVITLLFLNFASIIHAAEQPVTLSIFRVIRDKNMPAQQKINELTKIYERNGIPVINKKSDDIPHFTPLMLAAKEGDLEVVKFLLSRNAAVNATDDSGDTALMYAAREGNLPLVTLLLKHNANAAAINRLGRTPLIHMLAGYGQAYNDTKDKRPAALNEFTKNVYGIADLLIKNGTPVNAKTTPADRGFTAMIWAAIIGRIDIMELLIANGADVCIHDQFGNDLTYHLPNPEKKKLSSSETDFINTLTKIILKDCGWVELQ